MSGFLQSATPQTLGTIMLAVGIIIRYIIGMRQFNRRGLGGLQHFSNYQSSLFITFFEWVLKWAANGMILCGLFLLIKTC